MGAVQSGCDRQAVEEQLPIAVRVTAVKEEAFANETRYSATVKELQKVDLSFKVAGTVREMYQVKETGSEGTRDVQVGDSPPAGAVLAKLDEADYVRRLNAARERLAKAESQRVAAVADAELAAKEFARRETLSAQGAAPLENLDMARGRRIAADATVVSAERDVESARIENQQAQDDLDNCSLTVPEMGLACVAQKYVERNERVAPAQNAFLLIDVSRMRVAFGVPDSVVGNLQMGQELPVIAESLGDQRFTGRVSKIAPSADLRTRTFLVEVTIDEPGRLKPGMIVTISVGRNRQGILLPMTSIQRGRSASGFVVYRVVSEGSKSVVRQCPVELDGVFDNRVHCPPGPNSQIAEGDVVVAVGAWRLCDGQAVRVVEEEGRP
ncbi:MAG: efflux RND transporter periplasmic adaptor subunit [Thermoguttaceae bacterium]